jgi:hypothetical protein
MKRYRLRGVTLATWAFTGGVLWMAGWFRPEAAPARFTGVSAAVREPDDLAGETATRWKAMQPRHWRQLMYNH